ncbi:uncharacterized protein LOC117114509 [Anneissia japonica]|uniref:uncharacterized protein LOC117114509 n=1 Tax=Anneissia japonica TaxID=1529436 RepID=UPI0014257FF6|nr:uncharacterized protein LOC117114509 [Anneissia japonica]
MSIPKSCMFSLMFLSLSIANFGGDSTDGREFIIVFLQTIVIEKDPTLIVATTDNNCVVTVVIPKIFYFRTYEVAARTKLEIAIPKSIIPKTDGLDNLGILIKSTADISLWGMHDASSRSGDGFLALPTKILGREYFGVSYKPFSGAELGVVGIDDGTTVMITYDHPYTFGDRNIIANYPLKVKLDRFETMFINSHNDITGIHIESSAPVAAFSGNQCAFIPFSSGICNHIVTQLVPFERWGMTYVVTPFFGHIDYVVKVITGRYSSTVSVGGRQHVLEKMTSLTLNLTSSEVITAARPVLVVQFSFGMTLDNGNSYPTMLLVPAMQQFTNDAVIATFSDYHPSLHYLNLVATCYDLEKQYILIDEAQIEFVKKEVYVDGIAHCISQMLLNTSYSRITTIKPNVTFSAIIHERTKMFSTTRAAKLRLTNTTCSTTNKYGVTLAHNCDEKVVIFTYACPEPCPDKKEENYCGPCIDGLAVFIVMFLSSGLTICVEQFVRCCRAACQDEW